MTSLDFAEPAGSTVDVSVISGGRINLPTKLKIREQVAGHDTICCKKNLSDLGLPKAWKKKPPPSILETLEEPDVVIDVPKDVADQLREAGVSLDHVGDPSGFPSLIALIVEPRSRSDKTIFPGYPTTADAKTIDDTFRGHEMRYFFLLYSTGYTHEHMYALARTSENYSIFLGGDVAHRAGEFRPTVQVPLPNVIQPSSLDRVTPSNLSVRSQDVHLQEIQPGYARKLNNWDSAGYKSLGRWEFLEDFLMGVE
ncbi:hypothetical protein BDW71DRAFT_197245 [Aspergillus fruticulosus]